MKKIISITFVAIFFNALCSVPLTVHVRSNNWLTDIDHSKNIAGIVITTPINLHEEPSFSLDLIGGVSYLVDTKALTNKNIGIFSAGPQLTFHASRFTYYDYKPNIHLSVSPSYMTATKLGAKNLGIHFTFKDSLNIDLSKDKSSKALIKSFGLSIIHYSNAGIGKHNRGITIPFNLYFALNV